MYRSQLARIGTSLKDRDNLVGFLSQELGYKTDPVFYEPADLQIPPYLARYVQGWWCLTHYEGRLPFQVHLVQLTERPMLSLCRDIMQSFSQRHPGYFLFIFTKDYDWLLFMAIEWSLERIPRPGHDVWPKLPKPYPRVLLLNRHRLTENDLAVLGWFRIEPWDTEPLAMYQMVLLAFKLSEPWDGYPDWFQPYYYGLGHISRSEERKLQVEECLSKAEDSLRECLAAFSSAKIEEACDLLLAVTKQDEYVEGVPAGLWDPILRALTLAEEARDLLAEDITEEGVEALEGAIREIEITRARLPNTEGEE